MPASKAQQKAVSKYMKENYDEIKIRTPKGRKETIQSAAAAAGESVNAYINTAITRRMEQDGCKGHSEATGATLGTGAVSLPSEALKTAQTAAEAAGEGLPQFVARAVETQAQLDKLSRKMKGGERG